MHSNDPGHLHAHLDGDAQHAHYNEKRRPSALAAALFLTLGFAVVEVVAGFIANSLALISDAGHMVTDSASLGLALLAQLLTRRRPSANYSFGYGRAEALAAFVNAIAMLLVVAWIVAKAIDRFATPEPVQGQMVMIVGGIGLAINILVALILSRDQSNMNTRAALVHVMGDLLGSVAAVSAGVVIMLTGWMPIDPILSLLVALLILKSTIAILHESYHHLMEGVPAAINYAQIGKDIGAVPGVISVHDLHVWEMAPGQPALIAHLKVQDLPQWPQTLQAINTMLLDKHGIDHTTLQPEPAR